MTQHDTLWSGPVGQYLWYSDSDVKRIFPKKKCPVTGKDRAVPITLYKFSLVVRHVAGGEPVTFRRYSHQGQWLYSDSRDPQGGVSRSLVVSEVARMLFSGDQAQADDFLLETVGCE